MSSQSHEMNKLKCFQKQTKEATKELRNYEKRVKKIIQIENEYRTEMLEQLYSIAYPQVLSRGGRGGNFEVPAITKERAKNLQKKNPKIEKAVAKVYTMPLKKVGDLDPRKIDAIAKIK